MLPNEETAPASPVYQVMIVILVFLSLPAP